MRLSEIVDSFLNPLPAGLVLDQLDVEKCLKDAVRLYSGYAVIASLEPKEPPAGDSIHSSINSLNFSEDQDVDLNLSELAIIRPLFEKYVERQNATHLEASRGLGVDVYGRTVAEVSLDIVQLEAELPQKAFSQYAFTVGA